jgi:hypothetical protein
VVFGHEPKRGNGGYAGQHYAKRRTIEPQFRDTKDLQFGMGLSSTGIGSPMRRDRLLLISAFATALLTLLGAVSESLGMDRLLKSNTSKTRTHSLFRQGCMLYAFRTCLNAGFYHLYRNSPDLAIRRPLVISPRLWRMMPCGSRTRAIPS